MRLFSSTIHWASFAIELMLQDLHTSRTRGANSCLLGEPGETRLERLSQLRTGMRAVSSDRAWSRSLGANHPPHR